jgi:glycosyltransferase involved in cell wall biosynthesis
MGLAEARNTGLGRSVGDYLQFLDADDVIDPDKISRQVELLGSMPANALVFSSYRYFHETTGTCESVPPYDLPAETSFLHRLIWDWEYNLTIPVHSLLFRRLQLEAVGGFTGGIPTHEDLDLYLRLAMGGVDFVAHPECLAEYRLHPKSLTQDRTRMQQGYLMALGDAMGRACTPRLKILLFARYGLEVAQCSAHVLRRREINVSQAVFHTGHSVASMLSLLLSPLFLVVKVSRRMQTRQNPGDGG